jgi:hypothetical protein
MIARAYPSLCDRLERSARANAVHHGAGGHIPELMVNKRLAGSPKRPAREGLSWRVRVLYRID